MTAAADPTRRAELAAIHVAAKQLAIVDDTYRALVARFSAQRTESAGEMTMGERRALIEYFRGLGFKARGKAAGARRRPFDKRSGGAPRPEAAKLRALWLCLWQLGVVRDPSDRALASFLHRHTGLDALQWADGEQLDTAIKCLRGWCERSGYEALPFQAMVPVPQLGSFKPGLIFAQWRRLAQLGAFRHGAHADLGTWLNKMGFGVAAPQFLTHGLADQAIDELGRWLRRIAKPDPSTGSGGENGDAA
jgi:phage gp16-like protein